MGSLETVMGMIFLTVGFESDNWSLQPVAYFLNNTHTCITTIDLYQSITGMIFNFVIVLHTRTSID
jgi:hypothetical protein